MMKNIFFAFFAFVVMSTLATRPAIASAFIDCAKQAHEKQLRGHDYSDYMRSCVSDKQQEHDAQAQQERARLGPIHIATKRQIEEIRTAMQTTLKDADSAKFLDVKTRTEPDGKLLVCGLVNSKNSYGAYGGYSAFTATLIGSSAVVEAIDSSESGAASAKCLDLMR